MKRRFEREGSPSHVPHEKIPSIQAESSSVETSTSSSNDLGERLMKLPIELKHRILFSFSPKERCQLRLVNKAMLEVVDASRFDVQEIEIDFGFYSNPDCCVYIMTINPFDSAKKLHWHKVVSSSLPIMLEWAGAQLKTLKLTLRECKVEYCDSGLSHLCEVFGALNSENICPKLKKLILNMGQSVWDNNEIIFSNLLQYITKRQSQVNDIDHPTPFLHSLSLNSTLDCVSFRTSAVDPLYSEKRRKFLQDILDQCHGLKELDVDSLLVQKDLPIVALRYPTTLTYLKSERLGKTPEHLNIVIDNCPNLQIVNLKVGFPHDDANFRALPSLFDLRELTFMGYSMEEKIARIISQCLAAFDDHPFRASIARPWPQLKSVAADCYLDDDYKNPIYRLLLSGTNCCITSLHLTGFLCQTNSPFIPFVRLLFKALKNEDACPNLMELNIFSYELASCIEAGLATRNCYRQQRTLKHPGDAFTLHPVMISPSNYDILNDLLAYVTKRQLAVRLGKPFLRSLSIMYPPTTWLSTDSEIGSLSMLHDQLGQIHTTVQQILDQCHGLEELYMESLKHEWINPNKKKGKELMKLVPLPFPMTLKKLNGVWLDSSPKN